MAAWPSHYPTQCPPLEAEGVSGTVFRFTNRTNPKRKDFLSHYELYEGRDFGKLECQARGLSIYSSLEDCLDVVAIIPALRKKRICIASLPESSGLIAHTPSKNHQNHKTFWPKLTPDELCEAFQPLEVKSV